jgi:hypothetical protein
MFIIDLLSGVQDVQEVQGVPSPKTWNLEL